MDATAADFLPSSRSLASLRKAAEGCRGCELWKDATQTVFGEGRSRAELMLVGEQPGNQEERHDAFAGLVEDLQAVREAMREGAGKPG